MTDALLSRNGAANPLGKCSAEIKTSGPEDLKEALTALAFFNHMSLAEYVREILMVHAYGKVHVLRLQQRASDGTAGIGREGAE